MNSVFQKNTRLKSAIYQAITLAILSLVVNACTLINPTITKAKYDRVETDMTLSQVQDIMGNPGEASAEVSFNVPSVSLSSGVSNQAIAVKPSVYQWKNSDGSSMTAVFVNDKLVLKTQVNLK